MYIYIVYATYAKWLGNKSRNLPNLKCPKTKILQKNLPKYKIQETWILQVELHHNGQN